MNKFLQRFFTVATALFISLNAAGATLDFQYGEGKEVKGVGTHKKENYDVAIYLPGATFSNMKITGLKVPLIEKENLSEISLWLTTDLSVSTVDGKNVILTDILRKDAVISNDTAYIVLDEPYVVTASGVYAGYSFNVDNLTDKTKSPVAVSAPANPNGLFLHSSRSYRQWTSLSENVNASSRLTVQFESDKDEYAMSAGSIPFARAIKGEDFELPVEVSNTGSASIDRVGYTYEIDGVAFIGDVSLEYPVLPRLDRMTVIDLPIKAIDNSGYHQVKITLTEINGQPNASQHPAAEGRISIMSYRPVHRPVMEEYTSRTCGWCIRGIAALEYMNEKYPDDFIGFAIHRGDLMQIQSFMPSLSNSLPKAHLNRSIVCDPYVGTNGFIEDDWNALRSEVTPVDMKVTASLSGSDVNISCDVTFLEVPDNEVRMGYMLIKDDLHGEGEAWEQLNYYSGENPDRFIPQMKRFCEAPGVLQDFHYDHILVMSTPYDGLPGSIGDVIVDKKLNLTHTFPSVTDSTSIRGEHLIRDFDNLTVVAVVIDTKTGKILNGAKTMLPAASVEGIGSDRQVPVSVEYYDLNGVRISRPGTGICIKRETFADGYIRTSKQTYTNQH